MFSTLSEHLFASQSLLKERRRPTGGLREACKESLGGRGFHALVPLNGVKNNLWSLCWSIFPYLRKTIDYCFGRNCPYRGVSCRSLCFYCGRHHKGLVWIGSKTLWIFRGAFLRRKSSPSLTYCDLNRGVGQKGEFLSSWCLESPRCSWRRVISALRLSRPVLPMVYSSLWSIWATDLLR